MLRRILLTLVVAAALVGTALIPASTGQAAVFHTTLTTTNLTTKQATLAYEPQEVADAYDFSPLLSQGIDGAGVTAAFIEIDKYAAGDMQQFDQRYSLSDPTVQEYYVGGTPFHITNQGETMMDTEWFHALAPAARIQIYYVQPKSTERQGWSDMAQALKMAQANGARVVSISLGACGPGPGYQATASALAGVEKSGVSVFVSSGDDGARPGTVKDCGSGLGVGYPAGDPSVVAVGGTSLQLNDDNSIATEVAWRKSGGGKINLIRPTWQQASALPKDKKRWVPDVSFLGDPQTGVAMIYNGEWRRAGGTSLGAPCWAAVWALALESANNAGKHPAAAAPVIYRIANSSKYTSAFHDITSGTNGHYRAGSGWDAVTGWGTPDVTNLAAAVTSVSTSK